MSKRLGANESYNGAALHATFLSEVKVNLWNTWFNSVDVDLSYDTHQKISIHHWDCSSSLSVDATQRLINENKQAIR